MGALPSVSLVLDLYNGQGQAVTYGQATFTPNAVLTDIPGQAIITQAPVPAAFGAGGFPSVNLLPTDTPNVTPSNWAWNVTFNVQGGPAGYSLLLPAGPVSFTATAASPAVFTFTPVTGGLASLPAGTGVQLSGGSLPGGFTAATTYYVVNPSGATFQLAATPGGSALASSSTGSGALTVVQYHLSGLQAAGQVNSVSPYLLAANNLADVANPSAAQSNLHLGLAPVGSQAAGGDAANINGLINLGATKVVLQAGQFWLEAPIVLRDHTWVDGAGDGITIISPANAANCDVFQGQNFATLTGTGTATVTGAGPVSAQISNLTVDGNRSGQTLPALTNASCNPATPPVAGYGIRIFGRAWKLSNLDVRNCAAYGLWTEWGVNPANTVYQTGSVEGHAVNVKVSGNGAHGWYHRGATDCELVDVVAFQNNAAALNAGIDFWAEGDNTTNGSGTNKFSPNGLQLTNCHFWGTTSRWNLVLDCNASAANCHAEGAAVGCALFRGQVKWTGGSDYYIPGQISSWGAGVQFGDAGATAGVPTTAAYTANVAYFGVVSGTLADTAARAGIAWVSCNSSIIDALFIPRAAPTATVAAGSNAVDVSTFTGTGVLSYSGGTGMPPAGGTLTVATSAGTATVTYTGISGGSFTGCTTTAGSGTLSTGGAITLAGVGTVAVTGTIDAASDVAIEVTGAGLGTGVAQAGSIHFHKGRHRIDIGSGSLQYSLTNNGTDAFYVNTSSKNFGAPNGYIFRLYSDNYATKAWEMDGAKTHLTPTGPRPSVAVVSNAGAGAPPPTVSSLSNDAKGFVSMGTGTGPASGQQATVTFANAYNNSPEIMLTAGNFATASLGLYVSGTSASGFSIGFANPPAASQPVGTYQVSYHVLGS